MLKLFKFLLLLMPATSFAGAYMIVSCGTTDTYTDFSGREHDARNCIDALSRVPSDFKLIAHDTRYGNTTYYLFANQ